MYRNDSAYTRHNINNIPYNISYNLIQKIKVRISLKTNLYCKGKKLSCIEFWLSFFCLLPNVYSISFLFALPLSFSPSLSLSVSVSFPSLFFSNYGIVFLHELSFLFTVATYIFFLLFFYLLKSRSDPLPEVIFPYSNCFSKTP